MGKQTKKQALAEEAERRASIDIGPRMRQVSPVAYWWEQKHFKSEEIAFGAFELANQQGFDGMGRTIAAWMGLTEKQFERWQQVRVSWVLPGAQRLPIAYIFEEP